MEPNKHILIIEDNLSFAIELEMYLSKWGFEKVTTKDNSAEALEFILTKSPDLILMDINIKGNLNGVEVAQKVSDLNIPIIYMTGQKDEDFYENAKTTNAVSYLIKPFDELTLKGAIDFALPTKEVLPPEETFEKKATYFFIRHKNSLNKINILDIDFIESDGNYCDIYYDENKSTIKLSLKKLLTKLDDCGLQQIHKGYAVRLDSVEEILLSRNEVRVKKNRIPIGRTYKKDFMNKMDIL